MSPERAHIGESSSDRPESRDVVSPLPTPPTDPPHIADSSNTQQTGRESIAASPVVNMIVPNVPIANPSADHQEILGNPNEIAAPEREMTAQEKKELHEKNVKESDYNYSITVGKDVINRYESKKFREDRTANIEELSQQRAENREKEERKARSSEVEENPSVFTRVGSWIAGVFFCRR